MKTTILEDPTHMVFDIIYNVLFSSVVTVILMCVFFFFKQKTAYEM